MPPDDIEPEHGDRVLTTPPWVDSEVLGGLADAPANIGIAYVWNDPQTDATYLLTFTGEVYGVDAHRNSIRRAAVG